uniref:Uncharacterized protein n=1 Tax=Cyanothece sp. (strain PCC 7425 / ATCC 29141) TaxID=395961 RepID=B8HYT7_CYAP4
MSLAQRIRDNVARSRRTTAEILGVTAELMESHEQAIEHLAATRSLPHQPWTVKTMQQTIGPFRQAQAHFLELYGIRAKGWVALVEKVNTVETALVHLGYRDRSPKQ